MCKPGNGSIYKECRDEVFRQKGTRSVSNREMRQIIADHHGCMVKRGRPSKATVDAQREGVLASV